MVKPLVVHILTQLLEKPEDLRVEVFHDGPKTTVEIYVSQDDFKRVIGKDGRIIKAVKGMIGALEPDQKDISVTVT